MVSPMPGHEAQNRRRHRVKTASTTKTGHRRGQKFFVRHVRFPRRFRFCRHEGRQMMRSLMMLMALAGLTACGGDADSESAVAQAGAAAMSGVADIASSAAAEGDAPIEATREEVEQAWKCRGVMGAAFAARTIIKDGLPPEVAAITSDNAMFWADRAARMRAPGMTEQERDALTAGSVRVLATQQAIEGALPEIRACLAAQAKG
ncbi:MAG: hypothetical protein ACK4IC_07955 [Erythrobacter sp.]